MTHNRILSVGAGVRLQEPRSNHSPSSQTSSVKEKVMVAHQPISFSDNRSMRVVRSYSNPSLSVKGRRARCVDVIGQAASPMLKKSQWLHSSWRTRGICRQVREEKSSARIVSKSGSRSSGSLGCRKRPSKFKRFKMMLKAKRASSRRHKKDAASIWKHRKKSYKTIRSPGPNISTRWTWNCRLNNRKRRKPRLRGELDDIMSSNCWLQTIAKRSAKLRSCYLCSHYLEITCRKS